MDSSIVVCINLEDLLAGIFSILLANGKKLEITYNQLYEYENQVINFYEKKGCEIIVNNDENAREKLLNLFPDICFDDEKICVNEDGKFIEKLKEEPIIHKFDFLINDQIINILIPKRYIKKQLYH